MELLNCSLVNTIKTRIDESKKIPNYSDYVVLPNEGLIWSKKSNRFIGNKHPDGYYKTNLTDDNGRKNCVYFHRFIYTACYGPIPEGLQVNHIDEVKSNNRIDNLNLMTCKENCNFGTRNERCAKAKINHPKRSKPIGGYIGEELKIIFPSISEAGRNSFNQGAVASCCRGERKTHKGYEWRYL